jgi:hypothetical protein
MRKILAVICLLVLASCMGKPKDKSTPTTDFWEMKKDSKYEIFISGGEDIIYVKSYEFMDNGCCKAEYLRKKGSGGARWDTTIICGSFAIRTYEKR